MAAKQLSSLLNDKAPPVSTCSKILLLLRNSRLPRSDLVLRFGDTVLSRLSKSSKEYWEVCAQICKAATELGEFEIMQSFSKRILDRFPQSVRASVLLGCTQEARSLWKAAADTYIGVIKEQPMAPTAYKRQVAVLKSEMKIPEAVSMLNYYLSFYPNDMDAWAELCALCLSLGRYSHALFATSELVVNDPGNHAYLTLTADVYMTCRGKENVLHAREYYAASLIARKYGNLRALYGLWLACSLLADNNLLDKDEKVSHNNKLLEKARRGIAAIYDKLEKEVKTVPTRAPALAMINTNVVTGKLQTKKLQTKKI